MSISSRWLVPALVQALLTPGLAHPYDKSSEITLETFPLASSPGYSIRLTRKPCEDDRCQLALDLVHDGKTVAQAGGTKGEPKPPTVDAGNKGEVERGDKSDLGEGFVAKPWIVGNLDNEHTQTLAALPVRLDANNDGVLIFLEWESDYTRQIYELWVADVAQPGVARPGLRRIAYVAPRAGGGPFHNYVRLRPASSDSPFAFGRLSKPTLMDTAGAGNVDTLWSYESAAWDARTRKLAPARKGQATILPLFAAIGGSYPDVAKAVGVRKKWINSNCIEESETLLILKTDSLPLLPPGQVILGNVFLTKKEADAYSGHLGKCTFSAPSYVKRAM